MRSSITYADVAKEISMSGVTFCQKINGHSDFRQKEITAVLDLLDLTTEDLAAYFFVSKL
jgi:cyanate lyase